MRNARLIHQLRLAVLRGLHAILRALPRVAAITALYALVIAGYATSAWLADLGDTVLGPPIVQEGLRALIVMAVARAFQLRWAELTPWSRAGWGLLAVGVSLNLARGHFSETPLTLAFACGHAGLLIITTRLMVAAQREQRLADANRDLRRQLADARARIAHLEAPHDRTTGP